MGERSEAEIHEIVRRVLGRYAGSTVQDALPANVGAKKVVVIGADHGGYEMKEALKPEIDSLGYEVVGRQVQEASKIIKKLEDGLIDPEEAVKLLNRIKGKR